MDFVAQSIQNLIGPFFGSSRSKKNKKRKRRKTKDTRPQALLQQNQRRIRYRESDPGVILVLLDRQTSL